MLRAFLKVIFTARSEDIDKLRRSTGQMSDESVKYPTAYRFMSGYNDGSHGYARAYKTNDKRPEAHVYNSGYASGESKVKITAEILGGVRAKELEKHPEKTREKHGMWDGILIPRTILEEAAWIFEEDTLRWLGERFQRGRRRSSHTRWTPER